jgi:hypothetical protein
VKALAADIAAVAPFSAWIVDLVSPGLMKMLAQRGGTMIAAAGAPFKFAPPEGAGFFVPLGWCPARIGSLLKTAGRLRRLPLFLKFISLFPERLPAPPNRAWSGVVELTRTR